MLVLNTSKDPEMGLLTNSLYVYNFIGTCWEFRMVEYFEIARAQSIWKTYNALAITCKCNTLLF